MMDRYVMAATPQIKEFFNEIAAEMVLAFGINYAEAVARINYHWREQEFLDECDMVLHEDAHYWAMLIYYSDVPDWNAGADRSQWSIRPKPPASSGCWTLGYV